MPEGQPGYRVINGIRYRFPSEEKAREWELLYESELQKIGEAQPKLTLSQAGTALKSVVPGFVRGLGLASTGVGSVLDSESARELGKYLEEKSKSTSEAFGVKPYERYTTGAMLGETLGAMVPGMAATTAAAAAIPETGGASAVLIPALVGGMFGAAQGAGEVGSDIRQARERGAQVTPEQERNLALIQGGVTGLLEGGGGALIGSMVKGARGLTAAGKAAASAADQTATKELTDLLAATKLGMARRALGLAAEEGLSEGAQQVSQNILARGDISSLGPGYDPNRSVMEGVPESVLVGAAFGGVLGGGIDLYKKKTLEKRLSQIREKEAESAEVGAQLEDALIAREIQGQRQEQIARGILSEEAAKLADVEAAATQALQEKQKANDIQFASALEVATEEGTPVKKKRDALRQILSIDSTGGVYDDLSTKDKLNINKRAKLLIEDDADIQSLDEVKRFTQRQVPVTTEPTTTPEAAVEEGSAVVPIAPEISSVDTVPAQLDTAGPQPASVSQPIEPIDVVGGVPELEVSPLKIVKGEELGTEWLHGTSPEGKKLIEESGAFDPAKGKRQYDYTELGASTSYFAKPDSWWVQDPENGRAIRYKASVEASLDPNANIAIITDIDSANAFANRLGVPSWQELSNKYLALDNLRDYENLKSGKGAVASNENLVKGRYEMLSDRKRSQEFVKKIVDSGVDGVYIDTDGSDYRIPARQQLAVFNKDVIKPSAAQSKSEEGMAKLPKGKRVAVETSIPTLGPGVPLNLDVKTARQVSEKAYEQLKKLNVSDIYSTVVVDNFLDEKGNPRPEMARFLNGVIKIASKQNDVATSEKNLIDTINHEVVHGMKESGFFSNAEWNLLTAKFNPKQELDDDTIAAYQERFKNESTESINEKLKEEAVAHAIERLSDLPAKALDIPSVSLLSKVKSLARLGTAANNLGYTAEDLIAAVKAGDVGKRAIKGKPTVLDAIREGRTPRQLVPQAQPQAPEVPEELPEIKPEPADESEVPVELQGEAPERISREVPESAKEKEEGETSEEPSAMYKIIPQKPGELFVGRKDDSLVNMIERGVKSGTPTFQILSDIKDYLFETSVAKAALGPESELGKVVSLRQSSLDQYAPIEKSAENLRQFLGPAGDKHTAASSSAIVAIRQSQKYDEVLSTALLEGYVFIDPKTGFTTVKKSKDHALMPQLENLSQKGKLWQGFDAAIARRYMETERAIGNAVDILGGTFTIGDYQAVEAKHANDPDIQEWLRVLRNFNDSLIELNRYVGNFDQPTTNRYKRFFYSSLYRVPLDKDGYPLAPTASNAKIANLQGLKPIKGARMPVGDALENLISNARFMISYAMKTEAGVRTIRDAVDANIAKATETAKAAKVREPKFATDPSRVVRVNVKGKPEYYEIFDPLLYQAMAASGFRPSAMDMVGRSFGRVFRSGITRSFPFAFGNMFLDSINLWSLGIYKGSPIVAIPMNIIRGGWAVFNSDPVLNELSKVGLLSNDISARNAIDTAKNIKRKLQVEQDEALKSFVLKIWDGSVGFLERLSSASETVNRVQVYKNVLKDMQKAGVSADEAKASALYATMQYPVNFDTKGSGQMANWVASYLPFVSASAQGTDVFYRQMRDIVRTGAVRNLPFGRKIGGKQTTNPLQTSMIEASKHALYNSIIFGALYSLYMAAFEWEEWRKLRLDERYRTLLIRPLPGAPIVRIPVPQTLGAISLMLPAALAESIMGHEKGSEIAKSMASFFAGMFTFDPTPQFIRPTLEVATNKNFFTWRPIENESLQKLRPEYRYDERTNLTSKYISKFLNEVAIPVSPVQFEHLVRGYLGSLGMFASELISQTIDTKTSNEPERFRPLTDPHLLPGIGKIFLDPDMDRKAIDDYYAIKNAATQAANSLKMKAASEEFQSNPEAFKEMVILAKINQAINSGPEKEMQELRKIKHQVQAATASQLSPSRKTDVLKKINARMTEIARSVQPLKRYVPFNAF